MACNQQILARRDLEAFQTVLVRERLLFISYDRILLALSSIT
jgi:hypothetical protein